MKILFYSTPSFADCDFPLVKALMEKGHDVTYLIEITPGSCKRTLFNIEKCLPINKIIPASTYEELHVYKNYFDLDKVYIMNRGRVSRNYFRSILDVLKIARFINKGKYDILHTDTLFRDFHPLLYVFCKKWISTIHDPFPHREEISKKNEFYRKLRFIFVNKFVLLNKNQMDLFCKTYKINPSKILINKLGIYDNIQAFIEKDWKVRKNNILFFGRITPYKGIEYLCEAMKEVHQYIPDATLTIAGGGNFYFDISEYSNMPFIEIKNDFIEMKELAKLLFETSVVVCPYKEATQSGVIMTSFSMCKPVIASNVGGLGEMIDNGKSGILVNPCNIKELSSSIIKLLSDENKLRDMSIFIEKEYHKGNKSWEHISNEYLKFYNK